MAKLSISQSKSKIYLKPFHQFGRLSGTVDTLISHPEISRIHAIIEWVNNTWYLRDISKNGLWLNDKKVNANTLYALSLHDKIRFNETSNIEFCVENLDEPCDILVLQQPNQNETALDDDVVFLAPYNFLPTEDAPEIVFYFDTERKTWFCEKIDTMTTMRIDDGECIQFSNSIWQLIKGAEKSALETIESTTNSTQSVVFIFNISQDEEETELKVTYDNREVDLSIRTHHYLTALLARYRSRLKNEASDEYFTGWISIQALSRDLGLSESHINIQIHRARKQIAEAFCELGLIVPTLIERKKGYARFASDNFKIFKGNKLETVSTT